MVWDFLSILFTLISYGISIFLILILVNTYKRANRKLFEITNNKKILLIFWIMGFVCSFLTIAISQLIYMYSFLWWIGIFGNLCFISGLNILICSIWLCVIWSKGGKIKFMEKRNLKKQQRDKFKNKEINEKRGII